nr:uncharacterized protein LOC121502369 [Drosophila kikkawai]
MWSRHIFRGPVSKTEDWLRLRTYLALCKNVFKYKLLTILFFLCIKLHPKGWKKYFSPLATVLQSTSKRMQSFGTIFLWALAACTLWKGSLATSLRGGYMFQLDDMSTNQSDSICVPELRSVLNDVVQTQNQGNTNTRESDNEIKSKLETLEVKIGEVRAKFPQEVHAKLEGQLQGVENKLERRLQGLEGQLQEVLTKLEAKMDESLLAVPKMIETQLQAVVNQLQAVSNKIDDSKVAVPASSTTTIPSGFSLIGSRYFLIEDITENWETAERRCREMGGYLASFRNEDEIRAITQILTDRKAYWLGINDRDKEGHFVSVASQKPAPFLKWARGEPDDTNHEQNCIYLYKGKMSDIDCKTDAVYFICQADKET